MKKLVLTLMICSFFAATSVFAQVWSGSTLTGNTYREGRVGIGYPQIPTPTPQAKLDISLPNPAGAGEGSDAYIPHIRLQQVLTGSTPTWDITGGSTLNFGYGANASSTNSVLSFNNSVLNYNGTQLKVATGENQLNIGAMTSPLGNSGQYFAFGANPFGSNAWQFTGNSTNNGGAIIHGDNQGNLFFITRGTAASNAMNPANNVRLFISGSGDVGIGTSAIQAHEQLAVRGGMITTEGIGNGINLNGSYYGTTNDFGTQRYGLFMGDGTQLNLTMSQNTGQKPIVLSSFYGLGFDTNNGKMVICENGAVVIARDENIITQLSTKPITGDNKLDFQLFVEDGILAERVRVEVNSEWPDYVFQQNYNLMSLNTLNQFIQKNHHLPDIPSEKEVKSNGIDLAEMDGLLLKKIEELTLYTIEQQKLLERLQEQNATLVNRVEQLENQ